MRVPKISYGVAIYHAVMPTENKIRKLLEVKTTDWHGVSCGFGTKIRTVIAYGVSEVWK